jgi:hypothetical protein
MATGPVPESERDVSRWDALRSRVGSWFATTGAPPAWGLVGHMVAGLVLGVALAAPLPQVEATLLSALTGAIVAAAGSAGPSGIARRVALGTAAASLVLTFVASRPGTARSWPRSRWRPSPW